MSKIKVSVCCLAYNHEKFIKQTLDGFVMQKTNFPFEVLIHDDASTDSTADIIREYENKYPEIIKPIYQVQNQFKQGKSGDKYFNFPRVQGEYVSMCEGDDYWTDENKLQKQVDFLDKNPTYSIHFHPVKVIYEDNSNPDCIFPDFKDEFNHVKKLDLVSLLQKNFIQTNSVMYRWRLNAPEKIELFPDCIMPGDWFIHLLHAQVGEIGFSDEVMGVYRRHSGGLWYIENARRFHLRHGISELSFYVALEKQFPEYNRFNGHEHTRRFAFELFQAYTQINHIKGLQRILELCPDCLAVCS